MIKHRTSLIVLILFLLGTGCSSSNVPDSPPSPTAPVPTDADDEVGVGELELPPGVEPLPEPNPIDLDIILEEGNTAESEIGREGGTLEVTAADGTRFTLEIPAEALFSPELIRMTPAASVEGLPFEGGVLASINLEPEGLYFYQPVTLFIELPESVSTEELASFGTHESGQDFHLYPSIQVENALELHLSHFSGIGVVSASNATYNNDSYTPSQAQAYAQNATAILYKSVADPKTQADVIERLAKQWFYTSILVRLKNSASNQNFLPPALGEYEAWLDYQREHFSEDDFVNRLVTENELALDAIAIAVKRAIERTRGRCVDQKDPNQALNIVKYIFFGDLYDIWGRQGVERAEAEKLVSECFKFEFVFQSKIVGRGPQGGTATSWVSAKILLDTGNIDFESANFSSTTEPLLFIVNSVSPVPPECRRITITKGEMEVKVIVGLNLNADPNAPPITQVSIFFDFPTQPAEGIRCSGGGQLLEVPDPFWMLAYEAANLSWKSVAGGFETTLPIVNRNDAYAELIIEQEIPGNDATESSVYQLIHLPGS